MFKFRFNRIHDNTSSRLVLLTGYPPPRSYPVYDLKEINMLNKFLFLLFPLQWIYLRGVWKLSSGNPGSRRRRRGPWGTEEPGWWSTGRARSFHWCSALLTTTWNVHGFIYITKKTPRKFFITYCYFSLSMDSIRKSNEEINLRTYHPTECQCPSVLVTPKGQTFLRLLSQYQSTYAKTKGLVLPPDIFSFF